MSMIGYLRCMLRLRPATTNFLRPSPVTLHRDTRRRLRKIRRMVMTTPGSVRRLTPQEILGKLDSQFEKARESGDLSFFPSTVHKHTDIGVDVTSSLVLFFFAA